MLDHVGLAYKNIPYKLIEDNFQDILISADMIELSDVVSRCTEFLKCELHESNAIGKYRKKICYVLISKSLLLGIHKLSFFTIICHFLGIYRFAEGHNIEGLRDISLSYIHDNFFLVSQVLTWFCIV